MADEANTPETEEVGGRKMDPELRAMAQIIRLLDAVEEPARCRIVGYIADRYATAAT